MSSRSAWAPPHLALPTLALLSLLLAIPGEAKRKKKETFEGTSDVLLVEVPVNVTSRQGEPLRALGPESFEVYDEGQRQQITGFEMVDLDTLEATNLIERRRIEAELGDSGRRNFLLFFDFSFSSPTAVVKAKRAAKEFVLSSLHPTDLAGIAIYSLERGPQLLVTFTPDRAQLARALDSFGSPQLLGLARSDPLRFMLATPNEGDGALSSGGRLSGGGLDVREGQEGALLTNLDVIAKQMDKSNKAYEGRRITAWSSAMKDLARILASVQGRKHILYFSEGFDGRLLLGREPDPEDPQVQQDSLNVQFGAHWMVNSDDIYGNAGLQGDVERMLEEFRRADCVIHAIDIGGLGDDSVAARRAGRVGRDALFYLADSTGGDLYENANDFVSQLQQALKRTSVTYFLSFQPEDLVSDGSYHRLKIKTKEPKARLSHRAGYYAPRPFQDLHPLEKSLLASDAIASAEPSTDIGMSILAAPFKAGHGAYLPVIIEARGQDLLTEWRSNRLDVEIYAYATTLEGEMRGFFSDQVGINLDQARENLASHGLKYYGHLDLEPGEYLLRVLVRNAGNGRTGVSTTAVSVPSFGEDPLVVLPPFFLDENPGWILARHQREGSQRDTVVYPFTLNGEPYVPPAFPALASRQEKELCLVTYNLGQEPPRIEGSILAQDGSLVEGGQVDVMERTITGITGLDRHHLRFQAPGLATGDYTLLVAVTDPGTGNTETGTIAFSVRN